MVTDSKEENYKIGKTRWLFAIHLQQYEGTLLSVTDIKKLRSVPTKK
jgi:hypothetical protein